MLKQEEQKIKNIFELIADYTYDWELWLDVNNNIKWSNTSIQRMTGYNVEECLAMKRFPNKILFKKNIKAIKEITDLLITKKAVNDLQVSLCKKNGQMIWLGLSWQAIYDNNKKYIGTRVSIRDMDNRKLLEEQLAKNRERYKSIFEFSPEGIVLLDTKGNILESNNRLFDWVGYSAEEIQGKNLLKLPFLSKQSKIKVMEKFTERMLGKKPKAYKVDFIFKGTKEKKIGLIRAVAIKDDRGKIIEDLVMVSNITSDEKYKEEIRQNLAHQELLSDVAIKLNTLDEFDNMMAEVLKILGQHTKVCRVYIFEDNSDGKTTSNTFEWCDKDIECQKNDLHDVPYTSIPSWKKILKKDGFIAVNDVKKLPKDLYDILAPQNIKAILVLPIYIDKKFFGFIGFDDTKIHRQWSDLDREFLKTVSGLIANVYQRYSIDKKFKEVSLKNQALVNALGDLVYDHYVPENIIIWEGYEKVLGLKKEDMGVGVDGWLGLCHKDDIKRVEKELDRAIKGKKSFEVAYRFKTKDGYKWFNDNGVTVFDKNGKLSRVIGVMKDITNRMAIEKNMHNKIKELENMNKLMINRELKMVELKNKIKKLGG